MNIYIYTHLILCIYIYIHVYVEKLHRYTWNPVLVRIHRNFDILEATNLWKEPFVNAKIFAPGTRWTKRLAKWQVEEDLLSKFCRPELVNLSLRPSFFDLSLMIWGNAGVNATTPATEKGGKKDSSTLSAFYLWWRVDVCVWSPCFWQDATWMFGDDSRWHLCIIVYPIWHCMKFFNVKFSIHLAVPAFPRPWWWYRKEMLSCCASRMA